jgi:site-specific recombinase XerD
VSAIAINLAALPADVQALVRQHAAALVSDPTKDQRYRATQLGSSVADFLGWLANDRGAAEATLDSYERVLARLAIAIDKQPGDVLTQELRDVRDAFTAGQRRKVTAIIRSFFRWLYEEERISDNPAARLRAPRRDQRILDQNELYTDVEKAAIVTAQDDIMDRVGVLLLLRAGLRQAELRGLRVRDVNLVEKYVLVVRGKGGKPRRVPIKGELVRSLEELMLTDVEGLNRPRTRTEYLLCPKRNGRTLDRVPGRPMSKRGAHEWWYRCLRRAGLVEEGVSSGRRMHAARHTYATDLGRATGWNLVAVQKNLGHASLRTTADIYTHFAFDDQADAVASLPEIGED